MSKPASPTMIGAFVIGAIALAVGLLVILGGGKFFTRQVPVVFYFDGSVAGLSAGSAITFRGVRVGQVTDVFLRFDQSSDNVAIPIFGVISPEQIKVVGEASAPAKEGKGLKALIERGMRAQLVATSLVTGQMSVNLDFFRGSPIKKIDYYPDRLQIPTQPSTIEAVQETLQTVIHKIAQLPLDQLLDDIRGSIASITGVINNPKLAEVIPNLNDTLANMRSLSETLDSRIPPIAANVEAISGSVEGTMVEAKKALVQAQAAFSAFQQASARTEKTMTNANTLFQPGSSIFFDLSTALREVTSAARSFRGLSDTLARDPNSILFGRTRPGGTR